MGMWCVIHTQSSSMTQEMCRVLIAICVARFHQLAVVVHRDRVILCRYTNTHISSNLLLALYWQEQYKFFVFLWKVLLVVYKLHRQLTSQEALYNPPAVSPAL